MKTVAVACSWSGGKDSCLAAYRATQAGAELKGLLTMLDGEGVRSRSHGLRPEILRAQATAMGLNLSVGCADWSDYETEFKKLVTGIQGSGVRDVVFGDIDLEEHRQWEEQVCTAVGSRAHLPLWLADRRELVEEFLDVGFRARVVALRTDQLSPEYLGCDVSREFLTHCESVGVDAAGENGEYHTVVVDGPLFSSPVELEPGDVATHGAYAFLDYDLR